MQAEPHNRTNARRAPSGLMRRLRRHQAGSVLPIMAMAIIPLAGLVGGGVDMSRMYLSKARLQQACDAGALAGRKVMGGGSWGTATSAPNVAALQFFDGNFANGSYGTTNRTRAYTESAGKVTGTASVTVPMSVIRIFGINSKTIAVTCDADMRLPNTDIMFVLDTTGSMAQTLSGDTQPKIDALKFAVKCFYEVVAKLDTNAVCPGVAPSGGTSGVQIRFGFMPYATNVNVGRLLPRSFFADNWKYQTRKAVFQGYTNSTNNGSWDDTTSWTSWSGVSVHQTYTGITDSDDCEDLQPNDGYTYGPETTTTTSTTDSNGVITTTTARTRVQTENDYSRSYNSSTDVCTINKRTRTRNQARNDTVTQTPNYTWDYDYLPQPITGLKNASGTVVAVTNPYGWANSFTLPINKTGSIRGTNKTINWNGCIEERDTVKQTSYDPIPAGAKDLNIDLVPSQADTTTLWGPSLHDALYIRSGIAAELNSTNDSYNNSNALNYCPTTQARKLAEWNATTLQSYVDGLSADGYTYHDIGLLWGARFVSPTGIFASENALTPQGGEIERHVIFMTDGETCTIASLYHAYGYPIYDKRQSDTTPGYDTTCPGAGSSNNFSTLLNAQVNARFTSICTAIKNKNITLWVVYFGTTDATTTTRMTNCASPNRFYPAANSTALINTFRSIADQISQLRLTR